MARTKKTARLSPEDIEKARKKALKAKESRMKRYVCFFS